MRRLALAALLFAATALSSLGADAVKSGAAIGKDVRVAPLADVMADPAAYAKEPVVVEGVIVASCTRKGCWMQLAAADGEPGVRVTFKDYGFFIPLDAKGMKARAEGVAVASTLSKEDADHLEGEGAKLKRNPDGTAVEVSFVANGVELTK
jgi:hypothetical protein